MNRLASGLLIFSAVAVVGANANAEVMDRPVGITIGQRLTLKPYLSFSVAYDSNVDGRKDGKEDVVWCVNPGLGLVYTAESWVLEFNAFYQFNAYQKHNSSNDNNYHAYGENMAYRWTDSMPGERGWSLMIVEKFQQINQAEDIVSTGGTEYGRDRQEFKFSGALERRFTDKWHSDVNASYYWLDYDNADRQNYGSLYGWERWQVGLEVGYAASKWTDILIAGSYQGYNQDNTDVSSQYSNYGLTSKSQGFTVQGGFGSYATERIQYRALAGWSQFKFSEGSGDTSDGFTYTVSGNWKISETWNTMLMTTSYYQPTEREYGSSMRVDSCSWGIAHSMVRGKLRATFDAAYRRETKEYSAMSSYDYDLDIYSIRLGLYYTLNRYLELFCNAEYRDSICSDAGVNSYGEYYDYDRIRGTLGIRFTY